MYIELLYVYNKGLLCCSFLLIFYYEFYYSFYYKAAENRGKQRITEDNGTFTEYREKAQKRYVSGLLKWLYYVIHENVVDRRKPCISFQLLTSVLFCFYIIHSILPQILFFDIKHFYILLYFSISYHFSKSSYFYQEF